MGQIVFSTDIEFVGLETLGAISRSMAAIVSHLDRLEQVIEGRELGDRNGAGIVRGRKRKAAVLSESEVEGEVRENV